MEPIERDLAERKARLKRLAIGLQRLEDERSEATPQDQRELDRRIANLRHTIDILQFGIRELEEIVAEGPNPPRIPRPPPLAGRRKLSAEERRAIAEEARANLPAALQGANVQITVEPVTGPDGSPQVRISVGPPGFD